jgi:diketogulonate reductase-like aldo/keto reductase
MMPPLMYGTAWKKDQTASLVEKAVGFGFRGIDTACQPKHYAEEGVGAALAALRRRGIERESLFLQTKFTPIGGQDPARVPYDPKAALPQQVAQSFSRSLQNLGTEYLDALVLHSPLPTMDQLLSVWRSMEDIHHAGGARQLGISNCYQPAVLQALWQAARVKPTILQNRFYADTAYDRPLREYCRTAGITYQSFWTLTANPHILQSAWMRGLSRDLDRTPAQIFFRLLMQTGIVPLIGTTSEDHMQEDLAVLDFDLPEEQVYRLQAILQDS